MKVELGDKERVTTSSGTVMKDLTESGEFFGMDAWCLTGFCPCQRKGYDKRSWHSTGIIPPDGGKIPLFSSHRTGIREESADMARRSVALNDL